MNYQFDLSSILIIFAVLLNGLVSHLAWQRRSLTSGKYLAFLCGAVMAWQFAMAMSRAAMLPEEKLLWVKVAYLGISSAPMLFFCFALAYTGYEHWLTRRLLLAASLLPVFTLLLAWTNERHLLIWSGYQILEGEKYRLMHGVWFWVYTCYAYSLMVLGSILLFQSALRRRKSSPTQFLLILAGLWVAWGSNIISLFGDPGGWMMDFTPLALGLTGVLLFLGIWRMDLFDLAPFARAEVIERMQDGLIVIDDQQRLVDCNPAARIMLGLSSSVHGCLAGVPMTDVLGDLPGLRERLQSSEGAPLTVQLPAAGLGVESRQPRMYDVAITRLNRYGRRAVGHAITLHDVTDFMHMTESESRARQMAVALQEIGMAVSSTLQYDQVLNLILEYLRRLFAIDSCSILLLHEGELRVVAVYGLDPSVVLGLRIPYTDQYPNKRIIETRQVLNLADVQRQYPVFRLPMHRHIRSWMGAPLIVQDKVIGTVGLDSRQLNHFKPDDERNITAFAAQAAIAIQNSRLYTDAQQNALELEALNEIFQTITMKLDLTDLLSVVRVQVRRFFDFDRFLVATYQPEKGDWAACYITGADGHVINPTGQTASGLTGYVIHHRRALLLASLEEVQDFVCKNAVQADDPLPRSFMGVPLVLADKLIGAMVAEHHQQEQTFRADHLRLFGIIGSQVAIAMENARLFAEVREMAITDGLTGLFTRRHFFEQSRKAVAHARRYIEPISAMMIDLDFFKQINDNYGHASGDSVLHETAVVCRTVLREVDIIGRYGGEEIAVVMPVTTLEQAYQVADRLRMAISNHRYSMLFQHIRVSASIGVATLDERGTLESLMDQADQALYVAKQGGRNRVAVGQ